MSTTLFRYFEPIRAEAAPRLVAQVNAQIKSDMGFVPETPPPFGMHSPVPELMAGAWGIFRETLLVGQVRRGLKEAVATAVSEINQCPFCVNAHSVVLYATGDGEAEKAIAHHNHQQMRDVELQAVVQWAFSTLTPGAQILAHPPFASQHAPEMIGTTVAFQYLNRIVNALLFATNLPESPWLKHATKRVFGWLYTSSARKIPASGKALSFLPEAELPADFAWAAANPHIAGMFARFAKVVEQEGARVLSPRVRTLVQQRLQSWNGEAPGLSKQWVEQAITGLETEARATARLTLLAALASYQLDAAAVEDFRLYRPADADLVSALAWASFAAARRIGTWLYRPELETSLD